MLTQPDVLEALAAMLEERCVLRDEYGSWSSDENNGKFPFGLKVWVNHLYPRVASIVRIRAICGRSGFGQVKIGFSDLKVALFIPRTGRGAVGPFTLRGERGFIRIDSLHEGNSHEQRQKRQTPHP